MTLICCVDDGMGMMFNKRRQSRDAEVTKEIINSAQGGKLIINRYSRKLFEEAGFNDFIIRENISEDFPDDSFYFDEDIPPSVFEKSADRIILFRWNRAYPADIRFDIDLNKSLKLISSKEFAGKSHEKITMEVYEK